MHWCSDAGDPGCWLEWQQQPAASPLNTREHPHPIRRVMRQGRVQSTPSNTHTQAACDEAGQGAGCSLTRAAAQAGEGEEHGTEGLGLEGIQLGQQRLQHLDHTLWARVEGAAGGPRSEEGKEENTRGEGWVNERCKEQGHAHV